MVLYGPSIMVKHMISSSEKMCVCVCIYFEHLPSLLISPPIRAFPAQVLCFPNGSEVRSANSNSPRGPEEMNGFLNEQLEEMSNPSFQGFFPLDSH